MDSAKAKVKEFLSKSGNHDTTVHETTAPAVTKEQVTRTEHEDVTAAIDKEVHKDHYHTSVQPVKDSQTLPEQHHSKVIPVENRSFEHDNADEVQRNIANQQSQFKNELHHVEGKHTTANAPIVSGEHRHHHVHETIQPVIEKQTIEPHVVHTTVPVHEVHHDVSQHHAGSTLPAMTMEEFQQRNNGESRTKQFSGEPQLATGVIGSSNATTETNRSNVDPATRAANVAGGTTSVGSGQNDGHRFGTMDGGSRYADSSSPASHGKSSLMDKMNPRKDADGDGKAGFMK